MKIAIVAITHGGKKLAEDLAGKLGGATILSQGKGKISELLAKNWQDYKGFVCIMAAGIVVRAIAPLLRDKQIDPCVVVMDEMGHFAISLLSGHLGGGNELAHRLAKLSGGIPVITTASDTRQLVALDLWAQGQGLIPPSRAKLTQAAAILVNQGTLLLFTDEKVNSLPPGLIETIDADDADIIISASTRFAKTARVLRPRHLVVGIGCNRGTPAGEFEEALNELLADLKFSRASIRNLASIDKKNDEQGLLQFAEDNGWPIDFFPSDSINTQKNVAISFAALKAVGAIGVAEPAALLSAQSNHLISRKRKWKNVTMAIARAPFSLSAQAPEQ